MADTDDIVTVTLDEADLFDRPEGKTETPRKVEAEQADTTHDLTEQFKALEAEKEAERIRADRATQDAARERQERERATRDAQNARGAVVDTQAAHIASGLEAAEAEIASAKRDIKAAIADGDADRQAEAYDRLAAARAKQQRLDEARADIEVQRARTTETERRRPAEEQREVRREEADPVEALIANRAPKTAAWLRAHPDHARAMALASAGRATPEQQRIAAKLTAADSDAVAEGYARESKEYFEHVENFIGLNKSNGQANGAANGAANGKRRPSVPAAPVHQSGGGTGGNAGTEVRLTKKEAEVATDGTHVWGKHDLAAGRIKDAALVGQPIGYQEFARRKLWGMKNGLYDRSYTEQ